MQNNVKFYRTKANMKKREVAHQVGIHTDYVSMIERGARNPGFGLAKRMADLLVLRNLLGADFNFWGMEPQK